MAERAQKAEVPVELRIGLDMPHVWPFLNRITPEARRAMDEAAAFLLGVSETGQRRRAPKGLAGEPTCEVGPDSGAG
jgi:hypothetical protein